MRSSNPALKKIFQTTSYDHTAGPMTLQGTVEKSSILLLLVVLAATANWMLFAGGSSWVQTLTLTGGIGGFILALLTLFRKSAAPYTAPVYALLEGLFLGGVSAFMEVGMPGIVKQAVMLTFGVFALMLVAYSMGWIKATARFKTGVMLATAAVALTYLLSLILSIFGISVPLIHEGGVVGIIFSLVVVGVAALNLILDFNMIEEGAAHGAPKYMEWYASFGLLLTLIWLYLEILRLLSKLRD